MSAAEQVRQLAFGMTYQADDGKIVFIPDGAAKLLRELVKHAETPNALSVRNEMLKVASLMRGRLKSPLIAQEIADAVTAAFGSLRAGFDDACTFERSKNRAFEAQREPLLNRSTRGGVKLIEVVLTHKKRKDDDDGKHV